MYNIVLHTFTLMYNIVLHTFTLMYGNVLLPIHFRESDIILFEYTSITDYSRRIITPRSSDLIAFL